MMAPTPAYISAAEPLDFPTSEAATIGIYIEDLKTGTVTRHYNADKVLTPASVMKCITAASAQIVLPADFRFTTTVTPMGTITADGTLEGDIVITGGGDPTLGTRHIDGLPTVSRAVADYVRGLGITSVAGDVIIDESRYPSVGVSPYWLEEDIAWEYGAGLYGINYRDNSFSLTVSPGGEQFYGTSEVEVANYTRRGTTGDVTAMRGYDSSVLTLTGTIAGPKYTSRYSLPAPSQTLYNDVVAALEQSGIECRGGSVDTPTSQAAEPMIYRSPRRDEILRVMMVKSNNLYAEGMLRALLPDCDLRTVDDAIAMEKELWTKRGVSLTTAKWLDGCGLARTERMSARTLGAVLSYMARSKGAESYVGLFPLAGKEGTVSALLAKTELAGRMALKSGSMNGVVCYAGYKLDRQMHPTHTVVVMVNGHACPARLVRKAIAGYLLSEFAR